MQELASISEMYKFHFGSKIICSDGEEGTLVQVGFDPAARRMTHIGVKPGRLFSKIGYLPFDTLLNATGDGVTVRVTRADVIAASKNTPTGVLFDHKSVVEAGGQGATGRGTVLIVAVHPHNGELAYVVAHHLRPGQDTLVRQEFVMNLESDRIVVNIPEAILQTLPAYRPDDELQQEVEGVLFDLTPLHVDFKGMTVRVLDGVLYLNGNISSSLRGDIVQDQAMGVQGLLEIKNELVGDDTLAADLAAALGHDERTRDLPIGVYPRLGVVRLSGAVHNEQQKAAAEEITGNFPGVRGIVNNLLVNAKEDLLRVMAPAEGGESEDIVPGKYIRHTK